VRLSQRRASKLQLYYRTVTIAGSVRLGSSGKLTNSGRAVVQSTTTNSFGGLRFLLLPSGIYSLDATTSGFKTFRREGSWSKWTVGGVPVALQLGQVSDTVEVAAAQRSSIRIPLRWKSHGWKKVVDLR